LSFRILLKKSWKICLRTSSHIPYASGEDPCQVSSETYEIWNSCHPEKVTKQARMVYDIIGDRAHILHCFTNHKDYEHWYKSELPALQRSFKTILPDYNTAQGSITATQLTNSYSYSSSSFSMPPLSLGNPSVSYSISQLGNIGIGGTSLSLGQIILSLKELTHHQGRTITCSLQRYGSNLSMVAILNDPDSNGDESEAWEVRQKSSTDNSSINECIPGMAENLSFQIAHSLGQRKLRIGKEFPQTWQAFRYWILGWEAYYNYITTKNDKYLDLANSMAHSAKLFEPYYSGSRELLFNLGFAYLEKNPSNIAIRLFTNITDLEPSEGAFGLGVVYSKQGHYKEAIDNFSKAIELNSSYEDAWYNKGVALFGLGSYDEAIVALDESINLNPNNAKAWNSKGIALSKLRRYDESIQAFGRAIGLKPDYAEAWNSKGNVLSDQRKLDEAIQAYDKAIELKPDYNEARNNKGNVLSDQRKLDEAIQAYDEAIRLDPKFAGPWNGKGWVFYKQKNYDKATEAYDEAIKLDPKYAWPWNNKGIVLDDQKKYDEAIQAYDEAIKLDPKFEWPWNNKGNALEGQGKYDEAIQAYDEAIKLDPKYAEPWNGKGNALEALGRTTEANAAFAKAKELGYTG
jgi:tetratricopeptide (TPR) repeat protein